ncbi:tRNA-dihydrouridine synthase C [Planctomycetes bacterium Pla163]|uniref:tRNA-dihydrouridine synthase n=1 Tax=Rohdeia mirabilis TaxID=2528008 RepID=A0A518CWG8_9BACT|nr:tRNA-dihydrouridine synthase C [Planctomycetes bacterium Pla163]
MDSADAPAAYHPPLPFTGPNLLAPMEGVTDPVFRDLVSALHAPRDLGGTFTEFVRVVGHALPVEKLAEALGARRPHVPVGLQLMANRLEPLEGSVAGAFEAGAPIVDLNFGCPAKGTLRGCAGAALLDDPPRVEALVTSAVRAADGRPVSAKIRAGGEDDRDLETLARAVEAGGAALLTVHCRTRREGYADTADWERLRRAVDAVSIPVCGNGGVDAHADLARVRAETGSAFAMIGRGALADPWIFSGHRADRGEAAGFLLEYFDRMRAAGCSAGQSAGRVKQLLRHWTAGALVAGTMEDPSSERRQILRIADPTALMDAVRECGARTTVAP